MTNLVLWTQSWLQRRAKESDFIRYIRKWIPIASMIGLVAGLVMALFVRAIQLLEELVGDTLGLPPYLTMIAGGIVCCIFLYYGYEEIRSAGISYIVEHKHSGEPIPHHAIANKFAASMAALGTGLPAGKEGPAVVIGGAISYYLCEKFNFSPEDINRAILIGSAAATSATFQAPLGGTIFAAEVPYKQDADLSLFMPAFFASIIAYLTFYGIFEWIFEKDAALLKIEINSFDITAEHLLQATILGVLCAFVGIGFAAFFDAFRVYLTKIMKEKSYLTPLIGVILAAIVVGVFSIFLEEYSLAGTGFKTLNQLEDKFAEEKENIAVTTALLLLVGKILATSFAVGSGNSGGVFGPSLVVGALTGLVFATAIDSSAYATFMILGMSASHAAVTKTPIASMVLILEITGLPHLIIFMAVANAAAYLCSGEKSLYSGQLISREEKIRGEFDHLDHIDDMLVREAMITDIQVFRPDMPLLEAKLFLDASGFHSIPVLNKKDDLVGLLTIDDFKLAEKAGNPLAGQTVRDLMVTDVTTIYEDDDLRTVLAIVAASGYERFPVVERRKKRKLVGFLTLRGMIRAYEKRKEEWEQGIRPYHRV
ncbi:MAG: chloride channel protein [Candidatus Hodarchaeota archaeon]